jgi:DNA-binding CsgD family transcriptional regulator
LVAAANPATVVAKATAMSKVRRRAMTPPSIDSSECRWRRPPSPSDVCRIRFAAVAGPRCSAYREVVAALAESDVRVLLDFLHQDGEEEGRDPFPQPLRSSLLGLLACDVVNYFRVRDGISPEWVWEVGEPVAPFTSEIAEAIELYWHQFPVQPLPAFANRAVATTDVLPRREWHQREGWAYVERPLGIRNGLRLYLAAGGTIIGGFDFLDMGRGGIGKRERTLLELLAPHLARLVERPRTPNVRLGLTPREYEVLLLVSEGRTNTEVARILWLSPSTVRTHLEHAFEKLGVHTRAGAVARLLTADTDRGNQDDSRTRIR